MARCKACKQLVEPGYCQGHAVNPDGYVPALGFVCEGQPAQAPLATVEPAPVAPAPLAAPVTRAGADLATVEPGELSHNPAAVYLASLRAGPGRRAQQTALATLGELLMRERDPLRVPWHAVTYAHAQALRATLAARYAPATANRHLVALRRVVDEAAALGLMPADQAAAVARVKPIMGQREPAGRALDPGEIAALMAACERDSTLAGVRDAALIATMYPGGLRRDEVAGLDLADLLPDGDGLALRVVGKGDKERRVPLRNGAARALRDWLAARGDSPGPLFWPINKAGSATPARLTAQTVYNALLKRAEQAGIPDVSPHDLRRTTTSALLDAGVDPLTVAALLGHASTDTTMRYDRRGERARQDAAGRLYLPYHGRSEEIGR